MSASVVIAIGGNAITKAGQKGTTEEQLENIRESCGPIADLYEQGYRLVLTHGNGPQVGALMLQAEAASDVIPSQPVDVCGAQTQGQLGYMIQQSLSNLLAERNVKGKIASVVTQMVVSMEDPAFQNPTKPIGPFYVKEEADRIRAVRPDVVFKEDCGRGWRRVISSPLPVEMVEKDSVKTLMDNGYIVITAGGGGIPVARDGHRLGGVEAVIDKDAASALVAREIGADFYIILTGVDRVCVNFNKPDQKALEALTVSQAEEYMAQGQFPAGSMGPKMQSAIDYIKQGGSRVIITSIEKLADALLGRNGTLITA